ncbi:PQQ-binding-like beta-propeller repeat protein [Pelagibius litoralis]|uniref:PQQ-binding-like beta-propeller repeat protein n=1 Tax=Pelagibius litoralis TaxID=374515 RepID=A0A967KDN8_9PROT|nr:PQQ-like beta-propeller repeat protein [Pelagibius litoralis]NIA70320.1 PQQ-binding-like beta-propeller repeat protein [Pelagibius litoralis]
MALSASRAFLPLVLLLGLGACSFDDFFGESEDPPLPGERIAILAIERGLRADPGIADVAVRLPEPYVNTDWSQPGGSAAHAMYHLSLSANPRRVWSADVGEGSGDVAQILAQPLVVGDLVYAMDARSLVSAFSAGSGSRVWRVDLEDDDEDDGFFGGGITYGDGKIFVSTGFAKIFALNARSGEVLWEHKAPAPMRGAPVVSDGRVFAVTFDNQTIVVDAESGERLWNHVGVQETAGLLGSASPAVVGNTVIVPYSSGDILAMLTDSGRIVWSESLSAIRQTDPLGDIAQIRGLPVIDRDLVFAVSNAGRMLAVDLRQGVRAWQADLGGVQMPWPAGEFIYVLTKDSQLVCLRRSDGRIRWVQPLPRFVDPDDPDEPIRWSGPVLAGDRLVVAGSHGEVLSVSPYDGKPLGFFDLGDGAAVSPVVANNSLFLLTHGGQLIALR